MRYLAKHLESWSRKRVGFTLVEIMVAITIFGVVMSTALGTLLTSLRISKRADVERQVQEEARDIVNMITRDIHDPQLIHMVTHNYDLTELHNQHDQGGAKLYLEFDRGNGQIEWHRYRFARESPADGFPTPPPGTPRRYRLTYDTGPSRNVSAHYWYLNSENVSIEATIPCGESGQPDCSSLFLTPINPSQSAHPQLLDNFVTLNFQVVSLKTSYKYTVSTTISR